MQQHGPLPQSAGDLVADRYRIEEVLGRGGMAIVYRVLDERTGRQLALKRCFGSDRVKLTRHAAMLEREYHTLAQLAHPGIIEVYDFGRDTHGPYYTMELLVGSDLEGVDRLSWRQACAALHNVASSLAMLHWRGLLHRDVSMRNVHWGARGRAKLIDFGTMAPMGVSRDAVGTPPYIAPEALQLQALDARADLFSLGALGYRLLTGHHAFPARHFFELRDLWRSRPTPPNALVPEVPPALSKLVLRLLAIDRGARPQNAAEVVEQLQTIGDLEPEDAGAISRASLATPSLVGRGAALVTVRKLMLSLVRGDGGALLIRGVAGSGRSRMLDACALEGKLLGAAVVRADGRDASAGEWGVARALGQQLLAQFPKRANDAARLSRHVLSNVLEELRGDETHTATGYVPGRSPIIRELRDWVLSLSKVQRLVVLVDDADGIDNASLAWLSALADKAQRNAILLAVSVADDTRQLLGPALELLQRSAAIVTLEHLDAENTESLLRSVFGDVPGLPLCAGRIHELSHGNPRAVMELAQHLVDSGRARYEAGSWVLPSSLCDSGLPKDLAASFSARLSRLSEDARELVDVLALTDEDRLVVSDYGTLTHWRDPARMFRALDELTTARIVLADGDRYYFAQRGFLPVVQEAMPDERRRQLHMRTASLLSSTGAEPLRRAHHLLEAGRDAPALELLASADLGARLLPVPLLNKAVERAERADVPAATLHRLRLGVLMSAPFSMDYDSFRRVAPVVLARLEQDSGLVRYRELSELPPAQRLGQAILQTQQRYQATPERERVHTVFEAVRELARLSGAISRMAMPAFDLELVDNLPSLEPLFPLSPSLPIVAQIVEAGAEWVRGRILRTRSVTKAVLDRIAQPDRGGLDDAHYERVRLGLSATLGVFEAGLGIESALQRAKQIESHRSLGAHAWRIRGLFQLAVGNATAANQCARRAALLQVQRDDAEIWADSTTGLELVLRSRLDDMVGVKSLLEKLARLADRHPGWRPVELLGRARYCELQGDPATALRLVEAGLELAQPLRHPFFSSLVASHIDLLGQLNRIEEAAERALYYADFCQREELASPEVGLHAARMLTRAGLCDDALRVLTNPLQQAESLQRTGYASGVLYEARARIALATGDAATFESATERCTREYEKGQNPWLGARLARLFDEARERGLQPSEAVATLANSFKPAAPVGEQETVQSRLAECVDRVDRGRCALTLLLQHVLGRAGRLYVAGAECTLQLVACLPDEQNDSGVGAWVERYARGWLTLSARRESTTAPARPVKTRSKTDTASDAHPEVTSGSTTADDGPEAHIAHVYVDAAGCRFEAVPLFEHPGHRDGLVAVLVVESEPTRSLHLSQQLGTSIAQELIEYGDAKPWRTVPS